ncbi:acetoacetyl-CoA reductase [Spongiibacter thalassae]|uniref:acetoacetyl-CoA reductase n=1 Tax=Spongiibacter thalassae TaxID=2721624 RepID=UPI001B2FE615|nr:acetoacetyl-CoA reductase [Spongiibacter thalassae]
MKLSLEGKVALVTGGSGAIGQQVCLYLNRAGVKVVGATSRFDLETAQVLRKQAIAVGIEIDVVAFDAADFDDAGRAIAEVTKQYGAIDILVNCAGITRDAPLRKMTDSQWQQVMGVNLNSMFNSSRHVIEAMAERGWGRIINISSVNGQRGQFGQTNYSASKAGVHGFTMALAQEVARKGVTVNTVAPGYIDSPMIQAVPENIRTDILGNIPVGRFGQPRDIAAAVTFLCSPQASFITGAQIPVNGGYYMGH